MKVITWNCQGAFRKKAEVILRRKPDILVIQECEHPAKLDVDSMILKPTDVLWFGDNVHKGLGVFSYSGYRFQLFDQHNPKIKYVVPILVSNGDIEFTLFAIWANNREDPDGQYVEQIWKGIQEYSPLLRAQNVILIGDFNSNTIWDRKSRIGNHSHVVEKLAGMGIHSVYHRHFNQKQGGELHPTFYLHRNKAKPYHIDYCFSSDSMCKRVDLEVGNYEDWIMHSDHIPLMVEFKFSI